MPSWVDDRAEYEQSAREVCDQVRLMTKDHWFWHLVSWLLFLISFGRFKRAEFLQDFASTLGPVQAYPREWQEISQTLIAHESRHTRQFLFAGWFVPLLGWFGARIRVWVGLLPMALVYGLFPLPVFFAWGRFQLELDADSHAWGIALERGWMTPDEVRERAIWFADTVSGWAYLKSWPRSWARRAFIRRAEAVIAAHDQRFSWTSDSQ